MDYLDRLATPLGPITLASDGQGLTGLWFDGQKHFGTTLTGRSEAGPASLFDPARRWLELYFQGRDPGFTPALHLLGTPFQLEVWALLTQIPYGQTVTYGQLAARLAARRGRTSLSAQAVGGAVGHNPVSLIVPCHRVVGARGALTGYAGGLDKKQRLLALEGIGLPPAGPLTLPGK